ncbi:DUF4142 domain-containing protein [Mucilaginibacter sp. L3T2-6]|uniref:DUF4142 domain-containing protein n=1 Tax=Mucilaginibacter sp. L3T2-6 TaxID=3062491 RepID=UPI002675B791|nr:DUF4142 domain-containing protein [Mucilaginibacter sp. L3T2-6]MDO3640993.1 DUF4142 domain-containing protein [Mucilaginibacter sp. L3T2-6]MDV6213531.1 DUF4142 domain-containing protein [Mucilaginibacter sp. L3T2-6]
MKNLLYLSVAFLFLVFAASCHDRKGKNYNDINDEQEGEQFIRSGIESSMSDIKASGLAITNSNNHKVIGLAKMLIESHTKLDSALRQLEADKKMANSGAISNAHADMIKDLSKKSGPAFDKAYLQMIVNDHEEVVKLYTTASANSDEKIKKIASENLPAIKMQLDSANKICISLK